MTYEEYSALGEAEKIAASVAPCGLICELCSERSHCKGCNFSKQNEIECCCFQRKCCDEKNFKGCWDCPDFPCGKDMHDVSEHGVRLVAFVQYIKERGLILITNKTIDKIEKVWYNKKGDKNAKDIYDQQRKCG